MDETYTAKVRIINPHGLHARAAAQLIKLTSKYECKAGILNSRKPEHCSQTINDKKYVDAKSIMSVLCMAAEYGHEVEVATEGRDAKPCLESVVKLFNSGFDELN